MNTKLLDALIPYFILFTICLIGSYFFFDSERSMQLVEKCISEHGPDGQVCISLINSLYRG